jgi:hypothetical protein
VPGKKGKMVDISFRYADEGDDDDIREKSINGLQASRSRRSCIAWASRENSASLYKQKKIP